VLLPQNKNISVMRFDSLSDAILYYSSQKNPLINAAPYGQVAIETVQAPQNTNNIRPPGPAGFIYGQSLWGQGFIVDVSKPQL
jgi:hypothetical protein